MPLRIPVKDFFTPLENTANEFSANLRDGVATFACNLWSSFPRFVTENTNPANSFARGFMNSMCSPIQPPVPAPTSAFVGGQCPGVIYDIAGTFGNGNAVYGAEGAIRTFNASVFGPVNGLSEGFFLQVQHQGNQFTTTRDDLTNGQVNMTDVFVTNPNVTVIYAMPGTAQITSVTRVDGMPDDCGSLPPTYNSPDPTPQDLITIININNDDTLINSYEVQYVKVSNQYNFPMNFKVNGINVSLDFGGLNFYAPDGFTSPNSNPDLPPPGSDGGDDGGGGTITRTYPTSEYPIAPEVPVLREVVRTIEYLLCDEGVLSTITESLKVAVGFEPIFLLLIDILNQIVTDLCNNDEINLGLPEYYGLQPGADRPAIVYYWKEYVGGIWQKPTYTSTVSHPSSAAIANIPNIPSFEKNMGTYRAFVRLLDGSNIRATGDTPQNAQANFDFLINQVLASLLPANLLDATVISTDNRLNVKTVRLRQIEYYPSGKLNNAAPQIRRVVDPDEM